MKNSSEGLLPYQRRTRRGWNMARQLNTNRSLSTFPFMHDQVEFQCFLLWAKWGTWIRVKFRVPGQLVIVALFHKKEMEGYCKQQLIRVKFLCALTLVDFVFSILTLTALLVILHVSTELNKPLYLFWVRQDRCKLFYSLKWFCSCYFES